MRELYKLIPDRMASVIETRLCMDRLSELRIRNGKPVRACYGGTYYYLCESGVTKDRAAAFVAERNEAEKIVMRACDRSLYAVTDSVKRGYIPVPGGIRVGVCGSYVLTGTEVASVKDFSSVNIRIPHEVKGCAAALYSRLADGDGICNTLIISKPGGGKTTLLRDLCRIVSDRGRNVLLCDEKYELASCAGGEPTLDVGSNTDVVSGLDKARVFTAGIAYMRPDVIMTDELFPSEAEYVFRAVHSGIKVVATAHADGFSDFKSKPECAELVSGGAFSRYAVISDNPARDVSVFSAAGAYER